MAYQLSEINLRTVSDPKGFMEECDEAYRLRVEQAVEKMPPAIRVAIESRLFAVSA